MLMAVLCSFASMLIKLNYYNPSINSFEIVWNTLYGVFGIFLWMYLENKQHIKWIGLYMLCTVCDINKKLWITKKNNQMLRNGRAMPPWQYHKWHNSYNKMEHLSIPFKLKCANEIACGFSMQLTMCADTQSTAQKVSIVFNSSCTTLHYNI